MNENSENERTTIRDYLALIRRRRLVIVVLGIVGAAFALATSVNAEKSYDTSSSVRVRDVSQSLGLVGLQAAQGDTPAVTSAQAAETLVRNSVLERVRTKLGTSASTDSLRGRVKTAQDAKSNLITVTATAPTARGAANLADAVAQEGADTVNRSTQRQYTTLAARLRAQAARIGSPNSRRATILTEQAARLQGLGAVIQLVQVAKDATVPSSPTSPKPIRNTIVGLILGLFIGLIVAGILEALDRRVRSAVQAEEGFGKRVLAVVPNQAIGGVPVDGLPGDPHPMAMPVFQMLRTNVGFLEVDDTPKVVLVTSALAGEGKTSVSTGLALAAAASGRKTLLVEADLHRPTHAARLGTNAQPGLVEYLAGDAEPAAILQNLSFTNPSPARRPGDNGSAAARLTCISAGRKGSWSAELFESQRFRDFVQEVRGVYDLVVIDSAPLLAAAETLDLVPTVDALLYCIRLNQTTTEQVEAGKAALAKLPPRPTGLVVTGSGKADESYSAYPYSYAYQYQSSDESEPGSRPRIPRPRVRSKA